MNSEKRIEIFAKAAKLLQLDPLPVDVFDQLDKLEKQCPPEWRERFNDFYEAALAAGAKE